ncbi:hypothetical protein N836_16235 [Leptolyngbya sp. Heron Island J]|uniref:hypothetical protein n=1 Tax=Leptolyngbya sp. Heron Island J TaxID=1385935 RepID=UPI0003B9AD27|nr:hypothetical protein [Leptolyngbya sp. Heron Island J]ESA34573.1 hypothetical protein N836_16235 [Leptolyngbya sp. Heron Island J]
MMIFVATELFSPGEDSLNYRGATGTYLAEIGYDDSHGIFFEYDLKSSKTFDKASNLLVGELDVGDLTGFGYSNVDNFRLKGIYLLCTK